MATARSSRQLYKIEEITVTRKSGETETEEPIVVKMKKSHADLLGLDPMEPDDPLFTGTFPGTEGNGGKEYLRKIGGYRELPFTLVAKTQFTLTTNTDDPDTTEETEWKSITIGFPRGATMIEVVKWLNGLDAKDQIAAVISPRGARFGFAAATTE